MNIKYISGQEAFYDEDKQLWECYVGVDNQEKTLLYSVWGQTETSAVALAKDLVETVNRLLTNN